MYTLFQDEIIIEMICSLSSAIYERPFVDVARGNCVQWALWAGLRYSAGDLSPGLRGSQRTRRLQLLSQQNHPKTEEIATHLFCQE